ncbi:hypothetical protein SNEBB_010551 [Seison nebaliae]|nr:hypothetical protein SNEBB_010551 [Seison nebaliae]
MSEMEKNEDMVLVKYMFANKDKLLRGIELKNIVQFNKCYKSKEEYSFPMSFNYLRDEIFGISEKTAKKLDNQLTFLDLEYKMEKKKNKILKCLRKFEKEEQKKIEDVYFTKMKELIIEQYQLNLPNNNDVIEQKDTNFLQNIVNRVPSNDEDIKYDSALANLTLRGANMEPINMLEDCLENTMTYEQYVKLVTSPTGENVTPGKLSKFSRNKLSAKCEKVVELVEDNLGRSTLDVQEEVKSVPNDSESDDKKSEKSIKSEKSDVIDLPSFFPKKSSVIKEEDENSESSSPDLRKKWGNVKTIIRNEEWYKSQKEYTRVTDPWSTPEYISNFPYEDKPNGDWEGRKHSDNALSEVDEVEYPNCIVPAPEPYDIDSDIFYAAQCGE